MYKLLEKGFYKARLAQIIELGSHVRVNNFTKKREENEYLRFVFEFPEHFLQDEEGNDTKHNVWISNNFDLKFDGYDKLKSNAMKLYSVLDDSNNKKSWQNCLGKALYVYVDVYDFYDEETKKPTKKNNVLLFAKDIYPQKIEESIEKELNKLSVLPVYFNLNNPDFLFYDNLSKNVRDKINLTKENFEDYKLYKNKNNKKVETKLDYETYNPEDEEYPF